MTNPQSNPNDTFWLARYAHNALQPLFAQAKAIEPSLSFHIEINFADEASKYGHEDYLNINSHWARPGMFQSSDWIRTRADVDRFVAKVRADVAALKGEATVSA